MTLPTTQTWFIDIRKYIYDTLMNYLPLRQKIGRHIYVVEPLGDFPHAEEPFVFFTKNSDVVHRWIRTYSCQFDVYTKTREEAEEIRDIIIDLFNRRNYKWIRSSLILIWPDMSNPKAWYYREIFDFEFVFKDFKM